MGSLPNMAVGDTANDLRDCARIGAMPPGQFVPRFSRRAQSANLNIGEQCGRHRLGEEPLRMAMPHVPATRCHFKVRDGAVHLLAVLMVHFETIGNLSPRRPPDHPMQQRTKPRKRDSSVTELLMRSFHDLDMRRVPHGPLATASRFSKTRDDVHAQALGFDRLNHVVARSIPLHHADFVARGKGLDNLGII